MRGVCGQALPLPILLAHWAGCWGPPRTCCGRRCVGVGAQHCPLDLHALWRLHAAGVVGGRPRGGWPATVVRGVWSQALSLPRPPVLWGGQPGSATRVSRVRSVRAWGPSTGPMARALAGRHCAPWGWRKGVRGGAAVRRCEGHLGSGAPPPPAAQGRAVGLRYPRAVGASVRAWGPCTGPVARVPCRGLGATGVAGGAWVQAPPLPCCPPSGRAAGARWPRAVGAGVGVCGVCGFCAVRVVVRGAAFLLSLRCSPLRCFGAVWCPPCAVCLPCSLPCARPLLSCWLPVVSVVASSLFTLSSARPSPWHALFPSLRSGVCLCLFLRRLAFLSCCAL